MASDNQNRRIYVTSSDGSASRDGANLWAFDLGGTPTQIGVITVQGNELRVDGLGFYDGVLYGVSQFDNNGQSAGFYTIDLNTFEATLVLDFNNVATVDQGAISGLDVDPLTGKIYGTNDIRRTVQLIDLNAGTATDFFNYPAGRNDIDGLAIDDQNNFYLVEDENAPIQIYNTGSGTYTQLATPFSSGTTFSGGASIFCPLISTPAAPLPAMGKWALLMLGLMILSSGVYLLYRK